MKTYIECTATIRVPVADPKRAASVLEAMQHAERFAEGARAFDVPAGIVEISEAEIVRKRETEAEPAASPQPQEPAPQPAHVQKGPDDKLGIPAGLDASKRKAG